MSHRFFVGPLLAPFLLIAAGALTMTCSSSAPSTPAGTAGTSAAGAGGTGAAGTGAAGTGAGGTAAAGTGAAGTGAAGTGAAGTGAAGTGAAGTGTAGTGAAGTAADSGQSVLTRNKHETRDGFFIQPTLTKAMAAKMAPDTAFNAAAKFTGQVWSSPLYLENGPGGKGLFFVTTLGNDVFAIDETTGAKVWTKNVGAPPPIGFAGCGNTTGITGTPVIDAAKRTIYVAAVVARAGVVVHEVHALDVDTGNEKAGWPFDVGTLKGNGTLAFRAVAENQRGALSLVKGILYVPYGGHIGDCNHFNGWVVAIDTATPTQAAAWVTGGLGSGIWAAGGMASAGDGVFATTGNELNVGATHLDSEEVVHVTGLAQVNRQTGIYYPAHWRQMDLTDWDFGSVNPVVVSVGSATYVAAAAKDGHLYILNPANLGGMGGHLVDFTIATGIIRSTPAAYVSTTGAHLVMNAAGAVCGAGTTGNIVSVIIGPGPKVTAAWCAAGGDSSPIATSTDGKNETIVWFPYLEGIKGVDGDTGATIHAGTGCPAPRRWTSPIAVKGRIVVASDGQLCSWSPH